MYLNINSEERSDEAMTGSTYLEAYKSYIICQIMRAQEDRDKESRKIFPFVTISRQAGAGGTTIAKKLIESLNANRASESCPWALFDKELISKVIEEHNLPSDFTMFMPEKKVSEIQTTFEELFGLHHGQRSIIDKINLTILHIAQMGNAVIVGRGANIVTRQLPGGFHVRLIGPSEARLAHIKEYYNFTRKEALQYMMETDNARTGYIKKNYNKDINDNVLYDIVINTGSVSYNSAVKIIEEQVSKICETNMINELK